MFYYINAIFSRNEVSLNIVSFLNTKSLCRTTCVEAEMREMQKRVDMTAIEAFRAKDVDLKRRLLELEEMTQRRDGVRTVHEELRKRRLEEFMAGFMIISMKLKEMYQMITLGGDAELELVDSLDPFSEVWL